MSNASTPLQERPWWLTPGPEECPHCLRTYHVEVGYRCTDCDGPICPFCVVTVRETETVHCPDCHDEEPG